MFTPFGKAVRMFRIEREKSLKDMAEAFGVKPSYLSAIELGKKNATASLAHRVADYFMLSNAERNELLMKVEDSKTSVKLDLVGSNGIQRETATAFARKFNKLGESDLRKISSILKGPKT